MIDPTPEQIEAGSDAAGRVLYPYWDTWEEHEEMAKAHGGLVREAVEAALVASAGVTPEEPSGCICTWRSEDRGGGYSELVIEPEPDCAEHGAGIAAPVQVDEAKLPAVTRVTLAGRAGTLSAEHWDYAGIELLVQDDGRTLKVLPLRGGGQ